jgi:hypothetical protein
MKQLFFAVLLPGSQAVFVQSRVLNQEYKVDNSRQLIAPQLLGQIWSCIK